MSDAEYDTDYETDYEPSPCRPVLLGLWCAAAGVVGTLIWQAIR